jgi:hypothetical protein
MSCLLTLCFGGQFFTFLLISVGLFGKRRIDDLLRLGVDVFFCPKRTQGNPSSTTASGIVRSGLNSSR